MDFLEIHGFAIGKQSISQSYENCLDSHLGSDLFNLIHNHLIQPTVEIKSLVRQNLYSDGYGAGLFITGNEHQYVQ